MRLALTLVVAFVLVSAPARAGAPGEGRPPPVCDVGAMLPRPGEVPANIGGFLLVPPKPPVAPPVKLLDTTGGGAVEVPLTIEARGDGWGIRAAELKPGARYRFDLVRTCDGFAEPYQPEYVVGPEAPLPTTLGELTATPLRASNFGMPGPQYRTYYVDVKLTAAPEMSPWRGIYGGALVVDGEDPGPGGLEIAYLTASGARLWFDCGQDLKEGTLPPGKHTVAASAGVIAFDAPVVTTNTVELDIDCARAEADASTAAPASPSAPSPSASSSSSGDGCAVGRRASSGLPALGLLVVGAIALGRRRVTRR